VHHWLEEVVVDPHLGVEFIGGTGLSDSVEALETKISTNQR